MNTVNNSLLTKKFRRRNKAQTLIQKLTSSLIDQVEIILMSTIEVEVEIKLEDNPSHVHHVTTHENFCLTYQIDDFGNVQMNN